MRRVLAALLLCGCAAHKPVTPGGFATGSGPTIAADQASFIGEVFDDAQGTIKRDFPLSAPIRVDSLSGTISLYRLNGHCKKRDIASVGFLSAEGGPLVIWDLQDQTNAPLYASFPGGVSVSTLHFESYSDLCTPTDLRLALTMHKVKP